ncbi:MAG: SRPBCC family protein [Rectinemataceae bacterium]
MVDIIHRIGIEAPATQVYEALTSLDGLARWWTEEVLGEGRIGGKIEFRFRSEKSEPMGEMVMEVKDLDAQKTVRWRCMGGPPNGSEPTSPSNSRSRTTRQSYSSATAPPSKQSRERREYRCADSWLEKRPRLTLFPCWDRV